MARRIRPLLNLTHSQALPRAASALRSPTSSLPLSLNALWWCCRDANHRIARRALGAQFGESFDLDVKSPANGHSPLIVQIKGFRQGYPGGVIRVGGDKWTSAVFLKPLRFVFCGHNTVACLAAVDHAALNTRARRLEKRLLAVLEACWAKPMRGFFAASRWLGHVSEYTAPDCLQIIPLLLSFPISKLGVFCFERLYLLQLRHLRLLGLDKLADSIGK